MTSGGSKIPQPDSTLRQRSDNSSLNKQIKPLTTLKSQKEALWINFSDARSFLKTYTEKMRQQRR